MAAANNTKVRATTTACQTCTTSRPQNCQINVISFWFFIPLDTANAIAHLITQLTKCNAMKHVSNLATLQPNFGCQTLQPNCLWVERMTPLGEFFKGGLCQSRLLCQAAWLKPRAIVGQIAEKIKGTRFTNLIKFLIKNPANFLFAQLSGILPLACPLT
jgi:hypothetical protein